MPVDPFLVPLLAELPPFPDHIGDFDAFRAAENDAAAGLADQVAEPGPEVAGVETVAIEVEGGTIDLRIYRPFGDGPFPAHLYLHGGGWIGGTIYSGIVDIQARERCAGADCVVVLAEYRKAPEHQYPTGLNDSYAALEWIAVHADDMNVRLDVITIGGGSAGANLAAAVTLKARDEGGPAIAMQLLEAPALDLTLRSPSMERFGTGYGLTAEAADRLLDYYLPSRDLSMHPYVSPLLAPELSGLPPAHIMSSEYDPIRDDGERYADRLAEAGVPATYSLQAGHIHISSAFTKVMASARAWRAEVIGVLRSVHETVLDRQAS